MGSEELSKIETMLTQAQESYKQTLESLQKMEEKFNSEALMALKKLPGVKGVKLKKRESQISPTGIALSDIVAFEFNCRPSDIHQAKNMFSKINEKYKDERQSLHQEISQLSLQIAVYTERLAEFTTVKPLRDENPFRATRILVVHNKAVYFPQTDSLFAIYMKKYSMSKLNREKSKKAGNLYEARHPSKIATPELIFESALEKVNKRLEDKARYERLRTARLYSSN